MTSQNEVPTRISAGGRKIVAQKATPKSAEKKKAARKLFVVKLKRIPFGFFERELLGYFRQFGNVLRIRVARSRKTGNHKGWAYVGFDSKAVAEIAAESMNGYLMFEQRLGCKLMKPTAIPKSMLKGPLLVMRPSYMGLAKKDAVARNATTGENDVAAAARRQKTLKKTLNKLKALGIDYDFELPGKSPKTPVKTVPAADPEVQVISAASTPKTTPKLVKPVIPTPKTPKTPVEKVKIAEKTPKFSPKTRAGKAAAALAAATPVAAKSTLSKTIMKTVAASARPAPLKNPLTASRRGGKKKSL